MGRRRKELEKRIRDLERRLEQDHRRNLDEYESRRSRSRSRGGFSREHSWDESRSDVPRTPSPASRTIGPAPPTELLPEALPPEALPPEIENLLGQEGVQSASGQAQALHNSIATRWTAILTDGLSMEAKQEIIKKYSIPTNCGLLTPPKLNEEVAAALNESGLKRDQRIREQQTTMATIIASVGKVLNTLISGEISRELQIETLSDSARLLCDIYHENSKTRRALILPGLNKDMKDLMENTPISEFLFGDKLQDKVNAIKAVKKSAQELKNTAPKPTPKTKYLNFRGPRRQPPRPSGQKIKTKRSATYQTKPTTRPRRSPKRHPHQRRGQDRR